MQGFRKYVPRDFAMYEPMSLEERTYLPAMLQQRYDQTLQQYNISTQDIRQTPYAANDADAYDKIVNQSLAGAEEIINKYQGDLARANSELTPYIMSQQGSRQIQELKRRALLDEQYRQQEMQAQSQGKMTYDVNQLEQPENYYDFYNNETGDFNYGKEKKLEVFEKDYRPFQEQQFNNLQADIYDLGEEERAQMEEILKDYDPNSGLGYSGITTNVNTKVSTVFDKFESLADNYLQNKGAEQVTKLMLTDPEIKAEPDITKRKKLAEQKVKSDLKNAAFEFDYKQEVTDNKIISQQGNAQLITLGQDTPETPRDYGTLTTVASEDFTKTLTQNALQQVALDVNQAGDAMKKAMETAKGLDKDLLVKVGPEGLAQYAQINELVEYTRNAMPGGKDGNITVGEVKASLQERAKSADNAANIVQKSGGDKYDKMGAEYLKDMTQTKAAKLLKTIEDLEESQVISDGTLMSDKTLDESLSIYTKVYTATREDAQKYENFSLEFQLKNGNLSGAVDINGQSLDKELRGQIDKEIAKTGAAFYTYLPDGRFMKGVQLRTDNGNLSTDVIYVPFSDEVRNTPQYKESVAINKGLLGLSGAKVNKTVEASVNGKPMQVAVQRELNFGTKDEPIYVYITKGSSGSYLKQNAEGKYIYQNLDDLNTDLLTKLNSSSRSKD